ncbi:isopenicillin N synthase family dioxygenase [Halioxenophilus aromaticivorans]
MAEAQTAANSVPRISLQGFAGASSSDASRQAFIDQLWQALAEFGFVVISDHGISASTFTKAYALSQQLFGLPLAQKQGFEQGNGQRGYIAFGKETAKGSNHPDLKEYWHIGPELNTAGAVYVDYPANVWPDAQMPAFKPFFLALHQQLTEVALTLLEALALAMELPNDYFANMIHRGNSVQRLIHYPPLGQTDPGESVRAAAHADINLMTLLIGATDSGLELLDKNGRWLAVENQANDLVVDTGDMMALLTNNALPATVHRVVNPTNTTEPRYSIPFFVHPRNEVVLKPLAQFASQGEARQPISAGDYLAQRLRENGF